MVKKRTTNICVPWAIPKSLTCLIKVTAVVPLQKQSILGWSFNSLSITLNAFRNDSFSVVKISGGPSFSCGSTEFLDSSPRKAKTVSSEVGLPVALMLFSLTKSWLSIFTSQWALSFRGRESLTLLATIWPYGPWPSKTPQNTVSLLEQKFCRQKCDSHEWHVK